MVEILIQMLTGWIIGDLRAEGKNLTLMIQADMTAYHAAGEPPQLGLPDMYVLSSAVSLRIH